MEGQAVRLQIIGHPFAPPDQIGGRGAAGETDEDPLAPQGVRPRLGNRQPFFHLMRSVAHGHFPQGALRAEQERAHDRKRQQHINGSAREIHPEIAQRPGGVARKTADKRDRNRDSQRGGEEVVGGKAAISVR